MPRSADDRAVSSCGCCSMNDVVTPPGAEVGIVQNGLQERDVGRDAADAELGDRPSGAVDRHLESTSAAGQLGQHRVEVGGDLGARVRRSAVEPDPGAARRAVRGDPSGVRPEPVRGVLGGDPALQRGATDRDASWARPRSASVSPAAIRIWDWTRSTSVTSSVTVCSTWMRGFISMKTCRPSGSTRNSTVPALV